MRLWTRRLVSAAAALVLALVASSCGSKKAVNTVTVTISSSVGTTIIVGQSTTLTALVSGGTTSNANVTWQGCTFTTTTGTGSTAKPSAATACPSDGTLGTLSNEQDTTATYTAPSKVPDQTKFPGLKIIITAQSQQDTTKTGSITLVLDSGIGVQLVPTTATVPTNETQTFQVNLSNDLQSQGVTWLVTQSSPTSTTTVPNLATCSPTCGTITSNTPTSATYTAPSTVPTAATPAGASSTPASLTVVATSKTDNTRFATGTITIIQGGPITFNGISPTIAPQGAALWDVYLNAPNISSASKITLTDQNGGSKTFDSSSGQVKIIFPIPTTGSTPPPSIGARLRLLEGDLAGVTSGPAGPLTYTVSVSDPGQPVTNGSGPFTFTLIPVRPTVVASSPNGVVQGAAASEFPVAIDGGYFGPGGTFANAVFQGNQLAQTSSNSRRLVATFQGAAIGPPGLYPLTVARTTPPAPNPNNPAVTTISVFPDYSGGSPGASVAVPAGGAGTNPSAIDIDPVLGVAAVVETGSNAVQFFSIGSGSLSALGGPVAVGQIPTGVSVNRTNHSVAVVNYGSQSVSILPIPGAPNPVAPATIDLSNALQGAVSPAPLPYAIGVDPDTNLALVAYSSTSTSSAANLGFVVNLNQGANAPFGCLPTTASPPPTPPCILSQVTLNTGAYPQIAMAEHGHMAYVSPGGSGVVKGVDVTAPSTSRNIDSVTVTASIATATLASGETLSGLVPGEPATVLITGVPALPGATSSDPGNLNGAYSINIVSSNSFSYAITSKLTGTVKGGTVNYGSPNLSFGGVSSTTQGIAINPISRTAALADANATGRNGPEIDLLNQLDQSVSSISFFSGCTHFTPSCTSAPELLHTANVAWQPYTNSIVSYNPDQMQVSISDPITRDRYALVTLTGPSTATLSVQNGTTGTLRLWGGVAVDAATNQAIVVESGDGASNPGQIELINLGSLKPVEITEVVVPSPNPGPGVIGGIANASFPSATLTSTSDLAGVQIFGTGFASGAQVLLDGNPIPGGNVQVVSAREIDATIPAAFLSTPHRFALSVVAGGTQSNASDFFVIKSVDLSGACNPGPASPSSVAIADQIANGPFSPIAVVTNTGCNNISTIDINPGSATFGSVLNTLSVGTSPQGVAIAQHLGLAVVANNGAGTVSVIDLTKQPPVEKVADVAVGTNPTGIAVSEATGAALVANFGSNTVSEINLSSLFGSSPATSLTAATIGGVQSPLAVAVDPDRGTNNQGLAVVTGLQLLSGQAPLGALYPVDIGVATPSLSTTVSIGSVNSTPTGIVFNPAVATGTANPGLFYVNSSGSNVISSYNPDTGIPSATTVGINPTALGVNPQTGAILTSNFAGKSASIVDTLSSPVKTVRTLGLPGSPQFGVAIDPFTNLAVIVDQANNRIFLFPMPN